MKQKEISEIQVQLPVTKQIEGHSVVRGRSMFGDGGTMFFSRVSFILIESFGGCVDREFGDFADA